MASTETLALVTYGHSTCKTKPPALLNSIFMAMVNTAARTLVSVASSAKAAERWKPMDHVRYMLMAMNWMVVYALRVMMDYFPFRSTIGGGGSLTNVHRYLLEDSVVPSLPSLIRDDSSATSVDSLPLVLHDGSAVPTPDSLGRVLSHILTMLNEIPATSRKYQFMVAMADMIVDQNTRDGHEELLEINRMALSSAFARTSTLFYHLLQSSQTRDSINSSIAWTSQVISSLPFGSRLVSSLQGLRTIFTLVINGPSGLENQQKLVLADKERDDVWAEKHAQELFWITNKLRGSGAVDEALLQWSVALDLASLSLTINPRIQGSILKITAVLFEELNRALDVPTEVKFRLLVLWLPLLHYADNGFAYPVFSAYEKAELERIIGEIISSLPFTDQEIILTNWLQDFTNSTSDWPNLQAAYDRWCHSTRKLLTAW